ncbi:MAG: hypothetical protein ACYCVE_04295 [Gemmatimonadaceae bacterium]
MHRTRALSACFLFALLAAVPSPAPAQAGLGHLDDATVVPKGVFRFRAITAWTRFDSRFAPAGSAKPTIPLGAEFSFDSLGVAQLPALTGAQNAIQSLTGAPFRLSLGQTRGVADARIVVTPIQVEYGLTHRITLGVMLPLVRTRTDFLLRVNPLGTEGNVGLNPAAVNPGALARDSAVVAQLLTATTSLEATLQSCQANPAANPNCGVILSRSQDVTSLLQSATQFGSTFGAVYGASAQQRGAAVVPVTGSTADLAIRTRLTQLDSSFRAFLGAGPLITSTPAAAGAVVGSGDLQALLQQPGVAGIDSLSSVIRIGMGDLELSSTVMLLDGFADSSAAARARTWHARATITGTYRLPTGQLASASNPLDIATGRGTSAAAARLATYVQHGPRLGLAVNAEFTQPFGQTKTGAFPLAYGAPFPPSTSDAYPYKPGAVLAVEVAPRWQVTDLLGVYGTYDYLHVAANDYGSRVTGAASDAATPVAVFDGVTSAPGTMHAAGFGVTFSTVTEYERGKAKLPIDISFTHVEALRGAQRMPKTFRDQIQIRLYYRRGE